MGGEYVRFDGNGVSAGILAHDAVLNVGYQTSKRIWQDDVKPKAVKFKGGRLVIFDAQGYVVEGTLVESTTLTRYTMGMKDSVPITYPPDTEVSSGPSSSWEKGSFMTGVAVKEEMKKLKAQSGKGPR